MKINQYDIVLVNLEPTRGSEINKTRPCLVISPNEINNNLNTIIIVPITSTFKNYPTRLKVKSEMLTGMFAFDQIRTVDKERVIKFLDRDSFSEIKIIKDILKEMLID